MSEPMSSGEIEDVLSSIRRLVSEDLRPVAKDAPKDVTKDGADAGTATGSGAKPIAAPPGSKLLLTPALRVVSTQDSIPPAPRVDDAAFDALPEDVAPDDAELGPEVEADAPVVDDDDDDEDEPAAAQTAFEAAGQDEDWLPESSDDAEAYPGWAQAGESATAASGMGRVVQEIAAGVSDSDDDWEPETGDAPLGAVSWQAPEWVEEAELVDAQVDAPADAGGAARKAMADMAEEAAVAEIMARATQAKTESAAAAAAEKAAEKPEPGAEDDIFAEDEGYFDETVLRDLVRDLIREELSGTLGERITRNVRKLVRAEINRALTARDFD